MLFLNYFRSHQSAITVGIPSKMQRYLTIIRNWHMQMQKCSSVQSARRQHSSTDSVSLSICQLRIKEKLSTMMIVSTNASCVQKLSPVLLETSSLNILQVMQLPQLFALTVTSFSRISKSWSLIDQKFI